MDIFPHPQHNLDIFRGRLGADLGVDPATFTVACGAPTPTNVLQSADGCGSRAKNFNSKVDMVATGSLTGEVNDFLYNRLDVVHLPFLGNVQLPFLKGDAETTCDLLTAVNERWGTAFDVTDIQCLPIPVCDCTCGPMAVRLAMSPTSLLYLGQLTIYVVNSMSLLDAITQPYLGNLITP